MLKFAASIAFSTAILLSSAPAFAGGRVIPNDMRQCQSGKGPAVKVEIEGLKEATGKVRVQSYRGTKDEWLKSGAWLSRIEVPASAKNMTFCLPFSQSGEYAIAVRHDLNGNGKTDLTSDGGGMSNNPSINIFNLGKPSYKKTKFAIGNEVKSIRITMKYM
ncbi:DUF2141 domain-containing protein [Sphingorhabdus sp. SMR4y]|uniref:DUF2141 domain-containing protein n=1 Tax=Sphingorhabdus sp. SMR4y TaxID=2584094 RepID=UPI000B5D01A8|nr:DUF2141 domain-containing protein [Sphingorhabdus sp. SMR4y]ASK88617.1 hypothetical protein SPHFLASMR4Y_01871 [Sphingorhabdus sp. SMR4y]